MTKGLVIKAPAKRSQHANATYRNIVRRNMLRAFGHLVATCCDVLGVVGSNLTSFKLEPTKPNMSQHGGQTHETCCAQQCCDMLRWHVAIVWPGLYPSNIYFLQQPRLREISRGYSYLSLRHAQICHAYRAVACERKYLMDFKEECCILSANNVSKRLKSDKMI